MVLSTHALIGSALATLIPTYPVAGFLLAVASHFATDAIPHWDYKLRSLKDDEANFLNSEIQVNSKSFIIDLTKIGFDILLGLVLSVLIWNYFFNLSFTIILLGVLGGVLPDFLQFTYFRFKCEPLTSLQKFHHWIHSHIHLRGKYIIGPILQALLVGAFIALNFYVRIGV